MRKGEERSVALVIILTIVTCGIYHLIWIYQVSSEIRDYTEDMNINPGLEVLLCIVTCGIYTVFWYYIMGERIGRAQQRAGLPVDNEGVLYLILMIGRYFIPFVGLVAQGIVQHKLNTIWYADGPKSDIF